MSVEELNENYEKEKEKLKEMRGGEEQMETDTSEQGTSIFILYIYRQWLGRTGNVI